MHGRYDIKRDPLYYLHDGLSRELVEKFYSHMVLEIANFIHKISGERERERQRERETYISR